MAFFATVLFCLMESQRICGQFHAEPEPVYLSSLLRLRQFSCIG
jgi:hypothetical protein